MKFIAKSSELQKILTRVSGAVPSKSTLPILENFLFDLNGNNLTVTATDLEISLAASMQVEGSTDGRIAIPSKRLTDTVRALPDVNTTFSIDTTTYKIKITTENGEYALTGEGAQEFPTVPQFKGTEEIILEGEILRRIIHRTAFAVSTDELRPAMMGVLLQSNGTDLRAVATDGHRLVRFTRKLPKATALKRDIIIPAKALNILGRSNEKSDVELSITDTHVRFSFDKTILISKLIEEAYPNYESVIPLENDKVMVVNRDNLVSSIRRVALYSNVTTHQIRFEVDKNVLKIAAEDMDFGGEAREKLECEYDKANLAIGFNSSYVIEILNHLDSEQVSFKFSSPTRAGIVAPLDSDEGDDVIMLVMPVRLNT